MKLASENNQSQKSGIKLKTVDTKNANKSNHTSFQNKVTEMTEEILSSINPHDLDGLVIEPSDKQYGVETQLKKPLILENKHDLGKSVDDLMAFYNPHKYSSSGARVQTNSTAQINPEHKDGLVSEPQTVDNTPYWHEQLKKPLLPVNRDAQNDLMNV